MPTEGRGKKRGGPGRRKKASPSPTSSAAPTPPPPPSSTPLPSVADIIAVSMDDHAEKQWTQEMLDTLIT